MSLWTAIRDPLVGKTSLGKVFWVYGLLGSVLVSALGLFINSGHELTRRVYILFGLTYSVYVTVATYQCADNCQSKWLAYFVRVSAVISLLILPVLAYLDFTGALGLALIGEQ
jgi:hypothetical protein